MITTLPAGIDDATAVRIHELRSLPSSSVSALVQRLRCTESVAHELLAEAQRELVRLGERPMVYAGAEDTDRLLDVKDAAGFVGCHPNTVYAAVKAGALKSHGYGRILRFTRADLHAWTEA